MKNFHLALCVILLFTIFSSCKKITGKGPIISETRQTASFNGLAVKVEGDAFFTRDSVFKLELHAQQNILDEIETTVINNKLQIRYRHFNTNIRSNDGIKIYVSAPDVRSLAVEGSGYLEALSPLTPANLSLHVSGSGSIRINNITSSEVDADIDGSGHINVNSGNANATKVRVNGSGLMDVSGMMVRDADAGIRGSGNIKLFATQTLKASISGSGTISYKGSPSVSTVITGSGTVRHY